MKKWIDDWGELRTDEKNYHICIGNDKDNFITIGDPINFYTDYKAARAFAIEQSKTCAAVELRCESFIQDRNYASPVIHWSDRYENGKKQYREIWR